MAEKIIKTLEAEDIEIKEIDEEKRILWHKITKEVKDRMGDIVRIDGLDTSRFRKKPSVLYGHEYAGKDPLPIIGKNIGFRHEGKALYAGTKFLNPAEHKLSRKLADLVNDLWVLNKMKLLGWSMGFIPDLVAMENIEEDGKFIGRDFKKAELLEYSNVIIPANQEAINDAISKGIVVTKELNAQNEIVVCENCGGLFDYSKEAEVCMGWVKCPRCGALVDQEGNVSPKTINTVTKPSKENHVCVVGKKTYDKYRSDTRKHEGKEYTVRYGRIKGTDDWEEYEYFYSVDVWTAAEARSHCKSHDGTFEAATGKECEACLERARLEEKQGLSPDIIDRLNAWAEKRKQIRELISKILKEENR